MNFLLYYSIIMSSQAKQEKIYSLPSRNAIVSVCTENDGDICKTYADIATLTKQQRKHLCTDIYSLSIVNVLDPHAGRKYLKYIFACVE